MPLSMNEEVDLKKLIKERVENYPDLDGMVASGSLTYKGGWYEVQNKEAHDAIKNYVTGLRVTKAGKTQFKIERMNKRLKALANKL